MALLQMITLLILLTLSVSPPSSSQSSTIQMITEKTETILPTTNSRGVDLYCESWRFTVETNDAGSWTQIPSRCVDFVKDYISGDLYRCESEAVANVALAYAKTLTLSGNGKDAWVFDIDDTLLSNAPNFFTHGSYRLKNFDELSVDNSEDATEAPALPASLKLYKELQDLGFTIFLLTGREEYKRNATVNNLLHAGYINWERLILRGDSDEGMLASAYKSSKRSELEAEGYIIHGNSGDQWSDLTGFALARRSFKLPNPLYFIA